FSSSRGVSADPLFNTPLLASSPMPTVIQSWRQGESLPLECQLPELISFPHIAHDSSGAHRDEYGWASRGNATVRARAPCPGCAAGATALVASVVATGNCGGDRGARRTAKTPFPDALCSATHQRGCSRIQRHGVAPAQRGRLHPVLATRSPSLL